MRNFYIFIFTVFFVVVASAQNAADRDASFNQVEFPAGHYYVPIKIAKTSVGLDNKLYIIESLNTAANDYVDRLTKLNGNLLEGQYIPGGASQIRDFAIQPNGQVIVIGQLLGTDQTLHGKPVRLNSDFTIDQNFGINLPNNMTATQVLLQQDGKILFLGAIDITQNGTPTTKFIYRLNTDGSYDTTFNYNMSQYDGQVRHFAIQNDGKILIYRHYNLDSNNALRVERLNTDGTVDQTFLLGTGANSVSKILPLQDGRILISGYFNGYNGSISSKIALLDVDGSVVPFATPVYVSNLPFSNSTPAGVTDMVQQSDSKIIITGDFNAFGVSATVPNCKNIIRMNLDGSRDATYLSTIAGTATPALDASDNLYLGGNFSRFNNEIVFNLVKVDINGALSPSFNNVCRGFDEKVFLIRKFTNGKTLILGQFDKYNGQLARRLVRLNADGTLDTTFTTYFSDSFFKLGVDIRDIQILPDNKIILVGRADTFSYAGTTFNGIIKLNEDGSVDSTFNSGAGLNGTTTWTTENSANSIALQSDGKILISGLFNKYNSQPTGRIIRLLPSGALDTSFASIAQPAAKIFVQPDGKILATNLVAYTQRLLSNGTIEIEFTQDKQPVVAIQSDGKYIIRPIVNSVYTIRRLMPDGVTIDPSFQDFAFPPNSYTDLSAIQPDDKLILTYPGNKLVRLNANGQLDNTFNMPVGFSVLQDDINKFPVEVMNDGKLMVGSSPRAQFYKYNDLFEYNIVRLMGDEYLQNNDFTFEKYLTLYPNPTNELLNIDTKKPIDIHSISIFNMIGQEVLTFPNGVPLQNLNVSKLTSGTYFVIVNSNKGSSSSKFIKR